MPLTGFATTNALTQEIAAEAIAKGARLFMPYRGPGFATATRDALFAAGRAASLRIGIVLVQQCTKERLSEGQTAGREDGEAIARDLEAYGCPGDALLALDTNLHDGDLTEQRYLDYAQALQEVVGRPLMWAGEQTVGVKLKSAGVGKFSWGDQACTPDLIKDLGDKRQLDLGFPITTSYSADLDDPSELDAWMDADAPPRALGADLIAIPPLKDLQQSLIGRGYPCGPQGASGEYNTATGVAIANYYRDHPGGSPTPTAPTDKGDQA